MRSYTFGLERKLSGVGYITLGKEWTAKMYGPDSNSSLDKGNITNSVSSVGQVGLQVKVRGVREGEDIG